MLGRQTGTDVVSIEPGMRSVRTQPVTSAHSAGEALDALLVGTGYHAVRIDARSFRVVRDAAPLAHPLLTPKSPPDHLPTMPPPTIVAPDVVVTASKQRVPLLRYPGALIEIDPRRIATTEIPNLSGVADQTPVLQSTALGPGRDKIFIRGIADSSFNGAAQSTATIYFGDVQLGYSGSDPSIKLYDVERVEVLEGPQGTLYGSGSIGGIVRLIPNPVNLDRASGTLSGGTTFTQGGDAGGDIAGAINVPVKPGVIGLRLVGYGERDGGYISDKRRKLDNINQIDTAGGRAALRVAPGDGWRVDLNGLFQRIDGEDAQYSQTSVGPFARRSLIAQPFDNEVALASVIVAREWDSGLQFTSATGAATYHTSDTFDATAGAAKPIDYQTLGSKLLLSQEARLSRSRPSGNSWVVGFTLVRDRDEQQRTLGSPGDEQEIIGVTNVNQGASLFGENTFALTPRFSATLGARGTLAQINSQPSFRPRAGNYVEGRSTRRIDPTAAFSWKLGERLALFGRYQSGYRTGGLAVARGVGLVANYAADSIQVEEIGLRRVHQGETGVSFSTGVSHALWVNIQADLLNRKGQPYTANIGDARIWAVEGTADWSPLRGLRLTGSYLYTSNRVTGPFADLASPAHRRLPETPPLAANGELSYHWAGGAQSQLSVGTTVSYVGRSVLGTGDVLDIDQGQYTVAGLQAGLSLGRIAFSLLADNVTNRVANRFAFGNPFNLAARNEATPVRPRSVRLGVSVGW